MRVSNLKHYQKDDVSFKSEVSVRNEQGESQSLWFSVHPKYRDALSHNLDGFLLGLLYLAMRDGEDIHLEGALSKKLFRSIELYIIPLLSAFDPKLKRISIYPEELAENKSSGRAVGTGFSGGVDSFCTIFDRMENENDPAYKINTFLFANVGAFSRLRQYDDLVWQKEKALQRYQLLRRFPDELGLDFIFIDSNIQVFHPWGNAKTHTLTLIASVLALSNHFSRYYYSSEGLSQREHLFFGRNYLGKNIGAAFGSVLDPLLSTESTDVVAEGHQYSRVEKINRIKDYPPAQRFLNVCVSWNSSPKNCSQCRKCKSTLVTLDLLGGSEKFNNVFDILLYKAYKHRYILEKFSSNDLDYYESSLVKFLSENGCAPSRYALLRFIFFSRLKKVRYLIFEFIVKIKKLVRSL